MEILEWVVGITSKLVCYQCGQSNEHVREDNFSHMLIYYVSTDLLHDT